MTAAIEVSPHAQDKRWGRKALTMEHPLPHMLDYLTEKEANGFHPEYVRGIRNCLVHFSNFCHVEIQPSIRFVEQIERVHLVTFQAWLIHDQGYSASYSTETLKRLRSWLKWMVDTEQLDKSPWVAIKIKRITKTPNPLSDEELELLFTEHRKRAFRDNPFIYHRREMILALLYGWGLRINELVSIDLDDMDDMTKDFVRVRNKSSEFKTLPYGEDLKQIFRRYSAVRARHADRDQESLLVQLGGGAMTMNEVYKVIHDLGIDCNVKVNPHRLRDTCGTNLLDDDVPVERVAAILGHARISQTLQYSRVNDKAVLRSHNDAMGPRLNLLVFGRTSDLLKDKP